MTLPALFDRAAVSLLAGIPQTALLVTATVLALACLPAVSAAVRSRIWTLVFLTALLLSFAEPSHPASANPLHPGLLHLSPGWELALLSGWVCLSLLRAGALVRSAVHLRRIVRRSLPFCTPPGCADILTFKSRRTPVFVSGDVDAPSLAGFFRPRILLPAALTQSVALDDLRSILLHEMAHLRRRDHWTNLLQKLGLVLLPLNPVLFWVERRLCLERELACDDSVLYATGAIAYATSLTNLAERSLFPRRMLLAVGAWQRRSELAHRVLRILSTPAQPASPRRFATTAAVMMTLILGLTAILTRVPQLISFTPEITESRTALSVPVQRFSNQASPSMHLVRAAVPLPARTTSLKPRPHRASHKLTARRLPAPSWLLLTSYDPAQSAPVLTYAVETAPIAKPPTFRLTYAVVSVRNGWLVLYL